MKRKLLLLLVLLMTAVTGALAQSLYLEIDNEDNTKAKLMYGNPDSNNPCFSGPEDDEMYWLDEDYLLWGVTTITVDESCQNFRGTRLDNLFCGFSSLQTINYIGNLYTVSVTNMNRMFYGCSSLTTLDLRDLKTDNVTSMMQMFCDCNYLETLNLSDWKTSKVTDMSEMFYACIALEELDLSDWDTSSVTDMSLMFDACWGLKTLTLGSNWNTSNVTNMFSMFSGCEALTTLNICGWNTSKVDHMTEMFYGCEALTTLDLSGWNTSSVEYMSRMFNGCYELTTLDLSGWNTSKVIDMSEIFSDCSKLEFIYVGDGWSTTNLTANYSYYNMFSGCTKLPNFKSSFLNKTYAYMGSDGYLTGTNSSVTAKPDGSGAYWATFYSDAGYYQAPEGTQVFAVNLTGEDITITEITDRIVNMSKGVVLKALSDDITLAPSASANTTDYFGNSLVGTTTAITNPGNAYVLSKGNAGVGFYKLSSDGTIGANKAYLTSSAGAREFFLFGETTGISDATRLNDVEMINDKVYDLQGRRVQNPAKGLYIVNGKLVVIK